jgi:hypothetical protein
MKKRAFLTVLVFLSAFLFAQTAGDYANLLKGNLSAFAGVWVNGNGRRVYLRSDGTLNFSGQDENQGQRAAGYRQSQGSYYWSIAFEDEPGFAVMLLPAGVEAAYNVKTDTTRVRLAAGHDAPGDGNGYYYKEVAISATHSAVENLRLRSDQNLTASTIKVLPKGTRVKVQKWGNPLTVDGKTARWAYVLTSDGFEGWCFSGYLEEIKK